MAALADGADEAVPADHDPVDPAGEAVVMAAVAFDAQVRVGVAGDERGKALRTASICRVGSLQESTCLTPSPVTGAKQKSYVEKRRVIFFAFLFSSASSSRFPCKGSPPKE